jgi:hypothetical protein
MDLQRAALDAAYIQLDETTRCALAFNSLSQDGRALVSYVRYETRLRRIIDRASAELRRLRAERTVSAVLQNEPGAAQPVPQQLLPAAERPERRFE